MGVALKYGARCRNIAICEAYHMGKTRRQWKPPFFSGDAIGGRFDPEKEKRGCIFAYESNITGLFAVDSAGRSWRVHGICELGHPAACHCGREGAAGCALSKLDLAACLPVWEVFLG